MNKILTKIRFEKPSILLLVITLLIIGVLVFFLFRTGTKSLTLVVPDQGERWELGATHSILWESRNIDKVGIVLFRGEDPQWIARNVDAGSGQYDWTIDFGQDYGGNYWISVFEYPWHEDSLTSYSKKAFSIIPSDFFTCEKGSVEREWLYLPGDFDDLRRVFITGNRYQGDLGGLEGANAICQREAESLELEGEWFAFIGGEKPRETIIERLEDTAKGLEGIFVEALPDFEIEREEEGCYRLIAKNLDEFLNIFSGNKLVYAHKLSPSFFRRLDRIWLGRVNLESEESCIFLPDIALVFRLPERYSFSSTCQNWTRSESYVTGYREREEREFPQCFTPEGEMTDSVRLGALSSNSDGEKFFMQWGKLCDEKQHLVCIEY